MAASTNASTNIRRSIKYVGKRPKDDKENEYRFKLCEMVRNVGCFQEICAEKLYIVNLAQDEDPAAFCKQHAENATCPFILWNPRNDNRLRYEPFNMDFGPFNLATTHYFCSKLKVWLDTQALRHPDKYIVVVLDDSDLKRKLNMTLLVAIAAMVLLNMTAEEVLQSLGFFMMHKPKPGEPKKELVFRDRKKFTDVSGHQTLMDLTLNDCIRAFYLAKEQKFYDYFEFDHAEYLFYETVMSGDLNWIVPGKLLAFAGPSDKQMSKNIYYKHPPSFYRSYFKDHNVSTIVRLNDPEYESSSFVDMGFEHHDLIFPDGYPPTSTKANKFIDIVNKAKGAVAVHCYAGIGRTGTLIAAYLVRHCGFDPRTAVAWTRICRPGSVIGEQQDWLLNKFKRTKGQIHTQGDNTGTSPITPPVKESSQAGQSSVTTYAIAEKTYGQAKALMLSKKQRDNLGRACTRNSSQYKSVDGSDSSAASSPARKADLVLNLGKTIPLLLSVEDFKGLKEGENPKFYRFKDGKYEWKVKYPEPGYVALKYNLQKDFDAVDWLASKQYFETIFKNPRMDFIFEQEETQDSSQDHQGDETKVLPKLKPVVLFDLGIWLDYNLDIDCD